MSTLKVEDVLFKAALGELHLVSAGESKVLEETVVVLPLCLMHELISFSLLAELLLGKLALLGLFGAKSGSFLSISS